MGNLDGFKPNPPRPNQSQLAGHPAGDHSIHLTPFGVELPLGQALGYVYSVDSNDDKGHSPPLKTVENQSGIRRNTGKT